MKSSNMTPLPSRQHNWNITMQTSQQDFFTWQSTQQNSIYVQSSQKDAITMQ
ncbi:hypothetical protein DPMN_125727 [Dreissena polymorpha]|uniref:Uncharacterized protein n=1 Tax=Dreissena polymorpha TaxID=45954 RepID=A0A9D4GVZ2_DREPO|nr:hypothetical protein DPMN_125727 [Dreissena polymorpha]